MFEEVNLVTGVGTIPLIVPETTPHNPPTVRGYRLANRNTLLGAPSTLFSDRERVAIAGSLLRPLSHGPRTIALPINVLTNTPDELPEAVDYLLSAVDPVTQPIVTIETKRTGATDYRRIKGYVVGGNETFVYGSKHSRTARIPLVFKCPDPYWEIGEPQMYGPLAVDGLPVGDAFTIPLTSEIQAWPKWTILLAKGSGDPPMYTAGYEITSGNGDKFEQSFTGVIGTTEIGPLIDIEFDTNPANRSIKVTRRETTGGPSLPLLSTTKDSGILGTSFAFEDMNTVAIGTLGARGFYSVSITPKVLTA